MGKIHLSAPIYSFSVHYHRIRNIYKCCFQHNIQMDFHHCQNCFPFHKILKCLLILAISAVYLFN